MLTHVGKNSAVLLHVTLMLADGTTVQSTREQGKPALFRLGDGSLSAPLEEQLLGLQMGDKRQFTLPPEAVFGLEDPALIQHFTRKNFSQTGLPEVGIVMLFTALNGSEMPGLVREVTDERVTVDFNHPLAGRAITFTIEVLGIAQSPLEPEPEPLHSAHLQNK